MIAQVNVVREAAMRHAYGHGACHLRSFSAAGAVKFTLDTGSGEAGQSTANVPGHAAADRRTAIKTSRYIAKRRVCPGDRKNGNVGSTAEYAPPLSSNPTLWLSFTLVRASTDESRLTNSSVLVYTDRSEVS
jgi:hypothetical protein